MPHDGWRTTAAMLFRRLACRLDHHRSGTAIFDGWCRQCEREQK